MNNIEWFRQAKYGMMIHWGLYSMLAGEYKGKYSYDYAEWIQSYLQISISETEKLAKAFNPIYFDADEVVSFARECGMEYIVITSKHHEGFAMFRSEVDPFNVYDMSICHRDIIGELAKACEKQGMKLGLYYSQDLDWHEEHGGGYLSNDMGNSGTTWDNSWDFPDEEKKDYNICFEKKIIPQVKELLTNYGEICLLWFDVPMTMTPDQSRILYDTVKELQPDCLVNSRLGGGYYDYVSFGDNEIPESAEVFKKMQEEATDIDYRTIVGFKPSTYGFYETAATLNDTWGFSYHDTNWKSPERIAEIKEHLNSMGINYLLNVGPDALGRIPVESQQILKQVAKISENK